MKERMTKSFFFDTYALIEISKGNPHYAPYVKEVKIIITRLNLLEFIYFLIRENKENEITQAIEHLSLFTVDYDDPLLVEAAKMKYTFKKDKFSFIDCIGYHVAKKYNLKFLTGDNKFKTMPHVEFVK